MKAQKISLKKIMYALFMVFCVLAGFVFAMAWRTMSYGITASAVATEETSTWRFDDFSLALPKKFTVSSLNVSLNWAEARIAVNERWQPNNEAALAMFEEVKKSLAEKYDLVDISAEMGLPALMATEIPEIELADKPRLLISLLCENVQLSFILMSPESPADTAAMAETMKIRVRDFLQYYHPSPSPEVADGPAMRTRYGTVDAGPRNGYVFTLGFAFLTRGEESFYFNTITADERFIVRPGFDSKISRFFKNLSASGVISGLGIEKLSLDSVPGHEILRKHPYLAQKPVAIEFDWQEAPKAENLYAKTLALSFNGDAVLDPAARYGEWRQILESVRFTQ